MLERTEAEGYAILEDNELEEREKSHLQRIRDLARLKLTFLTRDKKEIVAADADLAPECYIQKSEGRAEAWGRIEQEPVQEIPIGEIYKKYGLETDEVNTVYMIGKFIKALPVLPAGLKREAVINLMKVSQVDIVKILQDGSNRLEALKQYEDYFLAGLEKEIDAHTQQIDKHMEQITFLNGIIEEKKNIKAAKLAEIQFEIQKISGIIDFIDSK